MKRFAVITTGIVLLCAAVFYFLSMPNNRIDIAAENGVLDLTGAQGGLAPDFSSDLFALDGEWEFIYGELYTPEDFGKPSAFIRVPLSWEKAGYPLRGFATYRLTVLTDEPELTLHIPKITFSSAVWINGKPIFAAGKPGVTQTETTPGIGTAFVNVYPVNGRLEIVAQAASYNWYVAGLRNGWSIGRPALMTRNAAIRYAVLAMAIGAMLVLAMYHLILLLYRPGERVYLAFALTLLSYSLRHVFETNGFLQLLLPGGMGEGLMRLYLSTIIFQPLLIVFFTHAAFAVPLRGKARCAVYALCFAVPAAITFCWPNGLIYADSFLYFVTVPMAWSAISAALTMKRRFNAYNMLYLVAIVVFIVWYPIQKVVLDDQLFMPGIASHLFLALSQCAMLSVSYAETKLREKELADENEALAKFGRMKTELIEMISHETSTPLTVLSVYSQLVAKVLRREGVREQTAKDLDRISVEARRIARLMDELKYQTRKADESPQKARMDLAKLIESAARMYRPIFERKEIVLKIQISAGLPSVFGAAAEITQVLFNLMNNARAHMDCGEIVISAESENGAGFAEVTVSDNGSGIEAELLPRVFERGVSDNPASQGLGLLVCKEIIDGHGGEISIESEKGAGTKVRFTLPVWRQTNG